MTFDPLKMNSDEGHPDAMLSPQDAAIVDALKGDAAGLVDADAARLEQVKAWIGVVSSVPIPEAPADLVARTMARVAAERAVAGVIGQHSSEEPEGSMPDKSWFFKHLHELATMSIAASLLGIMAAVGIFHARQSASRAACAANLVAFSKAFSTYGANYNDALPTVAEAGERGFIGLSNAGSANRMSNFDNVQPLVQMGLVRTVNMVCPARPLPERMGEGAQFASFTTVPEGARGYSYIDQCPRARAKWNGDRETILFADRNPLFDPATGAPLTAAMAESNSENHGHKGTSVLRADGSTTWELTPAVGPDRDNIWTVREKSGAVATAVYTGSETPETAGDIFLAP